MFKAISTGNNKYYGKKGETINIGDSYLTHCLKEGYIQGEGLQYLGNKGKGIDETPISKEGFIIRKVNVEKLIEMQNKVLKRIEKELQFIKQKRKEVLILLKPNVRKNKSEARKR